MSDFEKRELLNRWKAFSEKLGAVFDPSFRQDLLMLIDLAEQALTPSTPGTRVEGLEAFEEINAHIEKGRAVVADLQAAMDGHYKVIREYLGAERGPGFAHRINSLLLRLSGQFNQIHIKLRALKQTDPTGREG